MKIVLSFDVPDSPEDLRFIDTDRLVAALESRVIDTLIQEKIHIMEDVETSQRISLAKSYDKSIDSIVIRRWSYVK